MPKNSFQLGLEHVLNNKQANFMNNPHVFNEIHKNSGMSITQMMKHLGKTKANEKAKEPTEKEKSEQRLKELESKSNK